MDLLDAMKARHSVRSYTDRKIEGVYHFELGNGLSGRQVRHECCKKRLCRKRYQ